MPFCPHVVHAVKHLCPVLCLGSAGSGVERQDGIVAVILTGEERSETHTLQFLFECLILLFQFRKEAVVIFLHGDLTQSDHVFPGGLKLLKLLYFTLQLSQSFLHFLGIFHVIPELGTGACHLQFLDFLGCGIQIQCLSHQVYRGLDVVQFYLIFFVLYCCHFSTTSSTFLS